MRALAVASLAILPLLGGCVIYSGDHGETVTVTGGDVVASAAQTLEPLTRVSFGGERMTVVVGSNGCTQVSNFDVRIKDAQTAEISVVRREPDLCRAIVPGGVTLSWTYEELGLKAGQTAKVLNPLVV